ncbi:MULTISPECIES: hypothetical protein [unclassified Desulfovibrio]|uniref:hypothetical protein n=1 Tax=unclassified Desulfovibrio TaxID=2593640 RepID=UPI0013EC14D8|nr:MULTISPECIES: hypothetical protein [unclassified Desulfovibrio]
MAKTIWISALIKGCSVVGEKFVPELRCGNYHTVGDAIFAEPLKLQDLERTACFVKGMVNSSQNALAKVVDGWGPLGRVSTRFTYRYGVPVYSISNEFSRDGDIECVMTRDDAEKLTLLSQGFPCCQFTLLEIAEKNDFDIERLTVRDLKTLKMAVAAVIARHEVGMDELRFDDRVRSMINTR